MRATPYHVAVCSLIGLRICTATLSGFSQEYGYLEAFYAHLSLGLQGDLVPRFFGHPNHNTPPLYVWTLSAWGHLFGWSEFSLRLPSLIAWAATAFPIARLSNDELNGSDQAAVLLWLSLPLPFVLAAKAMPDMLLTCLIMWGLLSAKHRRPIAFASLCVAGFLIKPVAAVLLMVPFALGWRKGIFAAAVLMAIGALALVSTIGQGVLFHIASRGRGYWDPHALGEAFWLGLFPLLFLLVGYRFHRNQLALGAALSALALFALYATPDFGHHEYYYLPLMPLAVVLASPALRRAPRILIAGLILASLVMTAAVSMDNGDWWDDRFERMVTTAPRPDAVEPGMSLVVAWYTHGPAPPHTDPTSPSGVVWAYRPLDCPLIASYRPVWPSDGPLLVYQCA